MKQDIRVVLGPSWWGDVSGTTGLRKTKQPQSFQFLSALEWMDRVDMGIDTSRHHPVACIWG